MLEKISYDHPQKEPQPLAWTPHRGRVCAGQATCPGRPGPGVPVPKEPGLPREPDGTPGVAGLPHEEKSAGCLSLQLPESTWVHFPFYTHHGHP